MEGRQDQGEWGARESGGKERAHNEAHSDSLTFQRSFQNSSDFFFESPWDAHQTCILNFSQWSMKPFLDIDRALIETSSRINIVSSTAFCQCAVTAFMEGQAENPSAWSTTDGPGGTLIVTGATSAWRGSLNFGAFASGKGGLRNLTQSISREYGPKGVHVAFVVVDGTILTKRTNIMFGSNAKRGGAGWMQDTWQRLSPDSVANCYWYLQEQTPDAWSLEMDLRPAKENVAKI